MTSDIPAERLQFAVPRAAALVAAIEVAPTDDRATLDATLAQVLGTEGDTEAVVLVLANMTHALLVTLARRTGASMADLLTSIGHVE